jgi:hypothetical protein
LCAFAVLFATIEASPLVFPDWGLGGLGLPLASAAVAFQCQDFLRDEGLRQAWISLKNKTDSSPHIAWI